MSDDQWRKTLSAEEYRVLREKGTERPFTCELNEPGTFVCAGCGAALFETAAKFDSGTGWPSFYQPIAPGAVAEHEDASHGMVRTEVVCSRCAGHLGHVFADGPRPTGLRYCINGVSLGFEPAEGEGDAGGD